MVMTTGIMNVELLIFASSKKAMPVAPRSQVFGPLATGKFIKKRKDFK